MTQSFRSAQPSFQSEDPSATDVTSSIRPRNRRLVPNAQELISTSSGIESGRNSPSGSRAVSPIPSKHPSRGPTGGNGRSNLNGKPVEGVLGTTSRGGGKGSAAGLGGGLLEGGWGSSWNRLQGLANSVLGVDVNGRDAEAEPASDNGFKQMKSKQNIAKKTPGFWPSTGTWGVPETLPKKEEVIGNGSTTEREAALRVRKMARVLEGRDAVTGAYDAAGNMKRRTSVEETRLDVEEEGDALVYIHPVKPQDTLAGVILRYNCQPAVFRKANRFWPNDSIQTRKMVVLPVDACAVRGRSCEPPTDSNASCQPPDLLADKPSTEELSPFSQEPLFSTRTETSAEDSEGQDEKPWTHVHWVQLDSTNPASKPVQIARMPRKTLGYFPPRRRKSQGTLSTNTTPRASMDFSRSSFSQASDFNGQSGTPPRMHSISENGSSHSRNSSYFSQVRPSTLSRRENVTEAADRLGWMTGPGGVGTLGKSVRRPGPGKDAFNTWANKHVPGITIDSLPSISILGSEGVSFGFSDELARIAEGRYEDKVNGTVTPHEFNKGKGLEYAAAAVEGWFRRLAAHSPGTPKMSGAGTIDGGDLIELLDGTGSDDGRGFELTPGTIRSSPIGASGREDLDGVLRGRDKAGAKGGKSD